MEGFHEEWKDVMSAASTRHEEPVLIEDFRYLRGLFGRFEGGKPPRDKPSPKI